MRRSSVLASSVFGFVFLLSTAAALADDTRKVVVENTASKPVPVQSVDSAAAHAFEATVTLNVADGVSGANGFVSIPAGKRLVIQYASAYGTAPSGQILNFSVQTMLTGDSVFTPHYLPAAQQNADVVTNTFEAGTAVHLYCDTPQVLLRVDRGSVVMGPVTAFLSISGYLTDIPQ
jgi:hypothetical protein